MSSNPNSTLPTVASNDKTIKKMPSIRRVSQGFLCRFGLRHWCRIASSKQKLELAVAVILTTCLARYYLGQNQSRYRSYEAITADVNPDSVTQNSVLTQAHDYIPNPDISEDAHSILSMASEALKKTERFIEEEFKGMHQNHLDFNAMNFMGSDYDPRTDLSPEEWTKMHQLTSTFPAGAKIALAWPTIPVPFKGSDSRAVDAIRVLTEAGFSVDLIFWRDFASEIHNNAHDDTPERQRVMQAGVKRILGPYEEVPLSRSHTFVSSYHAMIFWLWPHIEWLDSLIDMISHVSSMNGMTKLIAAVDDAGVAARLMQGAFARSDRDVTMEQVFDYIYYNRPHFLLGGRDLQNTLQGSSSLLPDGQSKPFQFDTSKWNYAKILLQQEMYIYAQSDVLLGINDDTVRFLKKMVPAVPTIKLSYVSPVQPNMQGTRLSNSKSFSQRTGYLFFGYNNFANNEGMNWFASNVLSKIEPDHKLHIAGKVYLPSLCKCKNYDTAFDCTGRKPNIVCHGALSDEELDELIASSRVAINPVMEPSGVATKTCRAMAHGTPVVVTDRDGTFTSTNISIGGKRCKFDDTAANCMAQHLNQLLNVESIWKEASLASPAFVAENYGAGKYKRDWLSIIEKITEAPRFNVLLVGNADFNGESLASQNWHIANMLNKDLGDLVQVTVLADKLDPPIEGVNHAVWTDRSSSPLETGYQADLVIRQNWPPDFSPMPDSICGSGCRVCNILPWEFGSLPSVWMAQIQQNVDFLWAPSEYNRLVFEKSGFSSSNTAVAPAGVDCKTLLEEHQNEQKTTSIKLEDSPVLFLFTGGFIPRKGIDILLQEWYNVFCDTTGHQNDLFDYDHQPKARLIIQTSYELGFTRHEIKQFENIIKSCEGLMEWKRGWMSREEYLKLMKSADIYVAPFRSEGFGIPIVESLVLGKAAIAPVGGTAADDYMTASTTEQHHEKTLYPVHANAAKCAKDPCRGEKLCVFPPCAYGSCTCEKLEQGPSWFEVNRDDLRRQMAQAYKDVASKKAHGHGASTASDNKAKEFCWDNLAPTYRNIISAAIKSPIRRKPYQFRRPFLKGTNPISRIWEENSNRTLLIGLLCSITIYLLLYRRSDIARMVHGVKFSRVAAKKK